jgi:hypothetical protein
MTKHWHVQRHAEDDDAFVTDTYVKVFEYTSDVLERIAEFMHEGISAYGDQGDYEAAYRAYQRSNRLSGLAANAANIYEQGTVPAAERAPLYQDEPEQGPLWQQAATHTLSEINANGPDGFSIWECVETECAPVDEDAQLFAENVRSAAVILRSYPTDAQDALARLRTLGVEPAVLDAAWQSHLVLVKTLSERAFGKD